MQKEKKCPHCGKEGSVDDLFGWRTVAGQRRPQSYCLACRSTRPDKKAPEAPPPPPPKLTPPKTKPKVVEKPKKNYEPRNNYKQKRCRQCRTLRTLDCFEKDRCVFCARPSAELQNLWEAKHSRWATRAYKVNCDRCGRSLNPTKEKWVAGMCEECWPAQSRTELLKIWERYNP